MLALLYFYGCPDCLHFADFPHLALLLSLFASVKSNMCCLQNRAWQAVSGEVSFTLKTIKGVQQEN